MSPHSLNAYRLPHQFNRNYMICSNKIPQPGEVYNFNPSTSSAFDNQTVTVTP